MFGKNMTLGPLHGPVREREMTVFSDFSEGAERAESGLGLDALFHALVSMPTAAAAHLTATGCCIHDWFCSTNQTMLHLALLMRLEIAFFQCTCIHLAFLMSDETWKSWNEKPTWLHSRLGWYQSLLFTKQRQHYYCIEKVLIFIISKGLKISPHIPCGYRGRVGWNGHQLLSVPVKHPSAIKPPTYGLFKCLHLSSMICLPPDHLTRSAMDTILYWQ